MSQTLSRYLVTSLYAGACALALSIPAGAYAAGGGATSGSHANGPVIISKASHPGGTNVPNSAPRLDPPGTERTIAPAFRPPVTGSRIPTLGAERIRTGTRMPTTDANSRQVDPPENDE